jgi:hypothetical protein
MVVESRKRHQMRHLDVLYRLLRDQEVVSVTTTDESRKQVPPVGVCTDGQNRTLTIQRLQRGNNRYAIGPLAEVIYGHFSERKQTLTLTVRHLLDRVQEQFPVVGVHLCKKPSQLLKVASVFTANSPCL